MSLKDGQRSYKRYGLYSKEFFDNIFSAEDVEFIKKNYMKMTDHKISVKLNIKKTYVLFFRKDFLKLRKKCTTEMYAAISKEDIEKELNALVNLNYQGIMKDTYKKRIKYLENLLNN